MFKEKDEKMIVKRIFILLGFIVVPICIMLLSEALGINDYPIYEQVIGVLLIITGITIIAILIRHIRQTMDGILVIGDFILMSLIYMAVGFFLIAGAKIYKQPPWHRHYGVGAVLPSADDSY